MDRLLLQAVRQSPLNIRPMLGIKPLPSTKGRGYMAAGYLLMHGVTADADYRRKAVACLHWLQQHKSHKFAEYSWANHFDFASRAGRYPKDESIIVWTALIGQAFIDGYEASVAQEFLEVAESACRWIPESASGADHSGTCLSYHSLSQESIHNANMLGAALLARTWQHTENDLFPSPSGRGDEVQLFEAACRWIVVVRRAIEVPVDRQFPYGLQSGQPEMLRRCDW